MRLFHRGEAAGPNPEAAPVDATDGAQTGMAAGIDVHRLTLTALFIALIFIFTYVIKVPSPGMGYVHPGDGFILLAAIFLGPAMSALAAGVGSALADLIGGYFIFAPATLIIKAAEALVFYLLFKLILRFLDRWEPRVQLIALIPASVPATALMVLGYYAYEALVFGPGIALASVLSNIGQAATSIIIAFVLYYPLSLVFTRQQQRFLKPKH